MTSIVKGQIIPASIAYQNEITALLGRKEGEYDCSLEKYLLGRISKLSGRVLSSLLNLEDILLASGEEREPEARARYCRDIVFPAMAELRLAADELETLMAKKHWPLPSYAELLSSVR